MPISRLTDEAVADALGGVPAWTLAPDGRSIRRSFRFAGFAEAFGFMTQVAALAEQADHHPDWSNAWNRVDIALSTHDAGGLTDRDFSLARAIDQLQPN